ncbi:MAG: rhamnan synthesis F family protein [Actinomycetota bacterium]|nr:rhamnan synthesis F family protein [Actinomycetota bacterium]
MISILDQRDPVVSAVVGKVRCEHGSLVDFGSPDRVALAVHWSSGPVVSRSFRRLLNEFASNGYRPVVVSACEVNQPLEWGGELPAETIVLRKPNLGYDFGSWAVGLACLPIARAPYVILANDSLVGPFASLASFLERFAATPADVWSMTDTYQYFHHLQSYFLGFRRGVLAEPPLARFFDTVREEDSKWQIIMRNELALTRLLYAEGYVITSAFRSENIVSPGSNPVIEGWRTLLERGFPFVKREILRDSNVAPDGDLVPREVEARFGERVEDWI